MKTAFPNNSGLIIRKAEEATSLIIVSGCNERVEIPLRGSLDILSCIDTNKVEAFVCHTLGVELMVQIAKRNVEIIGGARGKTDDIINEYLTGTLETDDFTLECGSGNCSGDCTKCH